MERGSITKERRRAYKKKYRGTNRYRVWLAMVMIVSMLMTMTSAAAWADVPDVVEEEGHSVCHAGHEDCTWVEAVEGHVCEYIVDEDEEIHTALNCRHEHDSSCYPEGLATPYDASELDCRHQHSEDCYTAEKASSSDADGQTGSHVHDEDCGYVKEVKGVRCNHECEICDELYGELPKKAFYKSGRNAESTGDFDISYGDSTSTLNVSFDEEDNVLTISGKNLQDGYGTIMVGMKNGVETTNQCIVIEAPDAEDSWMAIYLDGINIETDGPSPITVSGSGEVCLELNADTENNLTINSANSTHAALEIGPDVDLKIGGASSFTSTGTLYATATRGTAIGGNYQNNAGKIGIYAGTVYATSGGTGIGGGYSGSAKSITIGKSGTGWPAPPHVTVNAGGTGIGAGSGASGKNTGPIVIQGEASVDVTSDEAGGIGAGFDSGTVESITILNAEVTVAADDDAAIGTGQQSEVGVIKIDKSTVNIQCGDADAGIGSGYNSENGAINITESQITIESDSMVGTAAGIGNGNMDGTSGPITISDSTLNFRGHLGSGICGDLGQAGGITLTDCNTTITDAGGITGTSKAAPDNGTIVISGGTLKATAESGTGIRVGGTGGSIELKDGCKVDLKLAGGIQVAGGCSLNVYDCELLYDYTEDYGSYAITGDGNVYFHKGSVVKITSGYKGIALNGDNSSLVFGEGSDVTVTNEDTAIEVLRGGGRTEFQNGSKVRAYAVGGGTFDKAVDCHSGTVNIASGADVLFVVKGAHSDVIGAGTSEGDACLVAIKSEADLAGKLVEIRDENGNNLTPAVTYIQQDTYKGLALKVPGPGKYTYYVGGKIQEFRDSNFDTKTVMDVAAGINEAIEIKGEGALSGSPVTGITLGSTKETVRAGGEITLDVQIQPADAANKSVTASSDDPAVATVRVDASGVHVRGYQAGTATITVMTVDGGYSATCEVKVLGEGEELEGEYRLIVEDSYASVSGAGDYAPGTVVSIHAGTRSGYRFAEWRAVSTEKVTFANPTAPDTTFVMPAAKVKVIAYWIKDNNGAATGSSSGSSGGSSTGDTQTWSQNSDGTWKCQNNGDSYQNEWAYIYNPYADTDKGQSPYGWFRFDAAGNMLTGWYTDETGNTYYLWPYADNAQGTMAVGWQWIRGEDGKERCYYFNPNSDGTQGRLLTNLIIEDKYLVDDKGAWVEDGVVVTR